ncbi:glycosyltransferase family 2 protein [Methyloterricola oryzae]|uniref:glycosyltransferase family 2 protein n=1 Tax=Methyloterricola oryzae TaxID=1495050 RepID=UPI0005EAC924|nr:glycosyltransferase family 2 protein [Methyloterricola oryzae]
MTTGSQALKAPVSAVIPCFRCAATIERAVASVVGQTLPPAELILVDDHSRDGTLEALQHIAERLGKDWVQVLALPQNLGAASARNRGWEAASQDYVAFLDADDAWHPQKTEFQAGYLDRYPDVAACGRQHSTYSPNPPRLEADALKGRPLSSLALLLANRLTPSAVMLRRALPLRFDEGRRHMEDHLLWLRLALLGHSLHWIDAPLAYSFKAAYGESGLSAQMTAMAQADFDNYRQLHREGLLGFLPMAALCTYSLLKSVRRLALSATRRPGRPQ